MKEQEGKKLRKGKEWNRKDKRRTRKDREGKGKELN